MKKVLIIICIAALALAGCGNADSGGSRSADINMYQGERAIENLTLSYMKTSETSSLNPYGSSTLGNLTMVVNTYEGLVGTDENGAIVPAVALSWEASVDYKVWTFHLCDNAYWVNSKGEIQAQVTSDDFITGLEWCLNFTKNEGELYSLAATHIVGAQEYINYTNGLSEEEGWNLDREVFLSMVGIEAPDPYTIVYTCKDSCAYFPSLMEYTEFLPASKEHIDAVGVENFRINNYTDAWYNGPYILTEYVPGNEKILDANPHWRGNDTNTRFKSVTLKCVENASIAYQLYRNGEIDQVTLSQSQIKSIQSDENSPYADKLVAAEPSQFSYQLFFNFCKKDAEGNLDENWNKAVSNKAFRLSWYYGLDLWNILKYYNSIEPQNVETESLIAYGLVKLSDGRDYVEALEDGLGLQESNGTTLKRIDKELAGKYKEQAIEELTELGVTFPIQVDYYIPASSQGEKDLAYVLKDCIEQSLGTDYVQFNIETYTSSLLSEVTIPGIESIAKSGWGADYADPSSILEQLIYGNEGAFISGSLMGINKWKLSDAQGEHAYLKDILETFEAYNEMYAAAAAINDDLDARYEAMIETEIYALSEGLTLPLYTSRSWVLTRVDTRHRVNSASSYSNFKYINLRTDSAGYTNDIWED